MKKERLLRYIDKLFSENLLNPIDWSPFEKQLACGLINVKEHGSPYAEAGHPYVDQDNLCLYPKKAFKKLLRETKLINIHQDHRKVFRQLRDRMK